MLQLAPNLSLPDSYVTSTGALLAVRGAGKSNTGAVIAEEMFAQQLPFVVIDPVSAWWGLRSSKNGKSPGLPIPIFGGKHGDVQLKPEAGELIADLVVDERLSCILDLKLFESEAAKRRFLVSFGRRLLKRNEDPLHLFLEECDDYLPQKPGRDQTEVLGTFENIVRRGRGSGLGITLISQRSAVVNKNVLTQTETLFAMRTTGPQDIDAVEAWLKYHQGGMEILSTLAALEDGEAWVWSPHFLKLSEPKRVQMRMRNTFDSGATPKNVKAGAARRVATLADIDLGAIEQRMGETIERARAEDPAKLRADLLIARKEIAKLRTEAETVKAPKVEVREKPVLTEKQLSRLETAFEKLRDTVLHSASDALKAIDVVRQAAVQHSAVPQRVPAPQYRDPRPSTIPRRQPSELEAATARHKRVQTSATPSELKPPLQGILQALRYLDHVAHIAAPDRRQVALVARQSASSSTFERHAAALKEAGLIDYPSKGLMRLTEDGARHTVPMQPMSQAELHDDLVARVSPAKVGALLKVVLDAYPRVITRDDAAAAIDASASSSTFERYCAQLKSLGLVEYPSTGQLRATDVLFFEGVA